ncbi:MAG: hypothetical protein HOC63_14515 [Rhodospirillales bacterium]|jgi:hypothetical protein|nr:hypothetical protein [Rhodospirillales bacterium]MBT4627890.1 hypothetical protein [Rhodospirillales bacterium]MBT6110623.1 hypothetical protein [Rhodospirillales bacterium]
MKRLLLMKRLIIVLAILLLSSTANASQRIMLCHGSEGISELKFEQNSAGEMFINQEKAKVIASSPDGRKVVSLVVDEPSEQVRVFVVNFSTISYEFDAYSFSNKPFTLVNIYAENCQRLD